MMQSFTSDFSITAGTSVAPSFVCEGGQLLFWPDTYDPEQHWDWTPFDAPERARLYPNLNFIKGKGKAKGGCR